MFLKYSNSSLAPVSPAGRGRKDLFCCIFDGESVVVDGFIDLDDDVPGLGLSISSRHLDDFEIT